MSELLVSIMIPTYRQEHLVRHAVGSALAQSYTPLEVVVVDDASPDATREALASALDDPRLRYVRNDRNLGRVGNYRTALRHHVRGDFVLNLDGDDRLLDRHYLDRAMALVAHHPDVALVFAHARAITPEGTVSDGAVNRGLPEVCDGTQLFLAHADGSVAIPHMTALYRRELALDLDFYSHDVLGADSVSLLSLLPGRRIGFVDTQAGAWYKHGGNASFGNDLHERLANFAVVDLPARAAAPYLSRVDLRRWRRRMGVRLAESYAVDSLAAGRLAGALAFVGAVGVRRPRVAAGVVAALARRTARRMVGSRA